VSLFAILWYHGELDTVALLQPFGSFATTSFIGFAAHLLKIQTYYGHLINSTNIAQYKTAHVMLGPSNHGMTRPRNVDEGDGLQIWSVAANIFNEQSKTTDKGLSSLAVGQLSEYSYHSCITTIQNYYILIFNFKPTDFMKESFLRS
jgi:hypothetical protein